MIGYGICKGACRKVICRMNYKAGLLIDKDKVLIFIYYVKRDIFRRKIALFFRIFSS